MIWVQDQSVAVADEAGAPTLVQGFLLDVTEVVNVTQELRESEERHRAFIETAWDAFITHVDGTIIDVRGSFDDLIGRTAEEIVGLHVLELTAPERPREAHRADANGRHPHRRGRHPRRRRGIVPVEIVSRNVFLNGVAARQLGVRDITQRRRAEAALAEAENRALHAQKLEAVGRLAGGIAHDFNNLLMAISGYADVIIGGLSEDSPYRAGRVGDTGHGHPWCRADQPAAGLLAPPGDRAATAVAVDGRRRRGGAAPAARGRGRPDRDPPRGRDRLRDRPIAASSTQILANLVVNAKDAMPGGGEVVIETRIGGRSRPTPTGAMHPGQYAVLTVSDSGYGHGSRDGGADLRAVLHDEGTGQGHRARAGDRLRDRQPVRRRHRSFRRRRARARRSRSGSPSRSERRHSTGKSTSATVGAAASGQASGCSWSRIRRMCARSSRSWSWISGTRWTSPAAARRRSA